jgi:hypothetical protein
VTNRVRAWTASRASPITVRRDGHHAKTSHGPPRARSSRPRGAAR